MVAHTAVVEGQAVADTAELTASMEAYASNGDWSRVEEIAVKLRAAVMQVPEAQRRGAITALQRSMEKVQTLAQDARTDVTGKLAALRRGRDATAAYGSATGTERALAGTRVNP